MEPRIDRPELLMGLRQLKIDRRGYKTKKNRFIGSNIIKMRYLEEGRCSSELKRLPMLQWNLLDRQLVHEHQSMCLLAEVLLVEVLPPVVLLALEGEMVLAESLFLEEKERIPPEWEIPEEEEEELPLSGASFVPWYFWCLFSSAGWTGGHRHLCFWFLPMHWFAVTEKRICEYQYSRCARVEDWYE